MAAVGSSNGGSGSTSVCHEGFLTKQGAIRASWLRRWFQLTPSALSYYTGRDAAQRKGVIPVSDIRDVRVATPNECSRPHALALVTPGRTYKIQAGSDADRDAWIDAIAATTTLDPDASFERRGVSAAFLRSILAKYEDVPEWTTAEIVANVVRPMTAAKRRRQPEPVVARCAEDKERWSGARFVGQATVFVSHAWEDNFAQVAHMLLAYEEAHPGTFFWLDIFSKNQHVATHRSQQWLGTTFASAIGGIGRVLFVFSAWSRPTVLSRSWCLWELHCAIRQQADVTILLSSEEKESLRESLLRDLAFVLQRVATIRSSEAKASLNHDKNVISDAIAALDGGEAAFDDALSQFLRSWLANHHVSYLASTVAPTEKIPASGREAMGVRLYQIGVLFQQLGALDSALVTYNRALELLVQDQQQAIVFANLGTLHESLGNADAALEFHRKALDVFENVLGPRHPNTASSYSHIGTAYERKGEFAQALEYLTKALSVQEEVLGPSHPDTIACQQHAASCRASLDASTSA
eukprot:m.10030 g.10030  ORF g.10030 m.10030 type:complete len:524 (+) comp3045_c0_seq1:295-1866(+)